MSTWLESKRETIISLIYKLRYLSICLRHKKNSSRKSKTSHGLYANGIHIDVRWPSQTNKKKRIKNVSKNNLSLFKLLIILFYKLIYLVLKSSLTLRRKWNILWDNIFAVKCVCKIIFYFWMLPTESYWFLYSEIHFLLH